MNKSSIVVLLFSVAGFAGDGYNGRGREAEYSVPVPSELAKFATMKVSSTVKHKGETTIIDYNLPEDVANGENIHLESVGKKTAAGFQEFVGTKGSGTCQWKSDEKYRCLIYYNFSPDIKEMEALLEKKYGNNAETDLRKQIMRVFSNDPAGILSIGFKSE